ncbi:MAG: hypothetical protein PHE27_01225 [Alphaproteobacteria bacterium]|nr:hypothetical protein [Alphaproteobacteria bacterium]
MKHTEQDVKKAPGGPGLEKSSEEANVEPGATRPQKKKGQVLKDTCG